MTEKNSHRDSLQQETLAYGIRYAYHLYVQALRGELARHKILLGEWVVLRVLWRTDGLSQITLATRMRVEKASLTRILDKMHRRGLIDRRPDPDDRRKMIISLTSRGMKLKPVLLPLAEDFETRITEHMGQAKAQQLKSLLIKLIDGLEAENRRRDAT